MVTSTTKKTTTETAPTPSTQISTEVYSGIDSWDGAIRATYQHFGDVVLAHEDTTLGDGFRIATEKEKRSFLVGRPLLLVEWTFSESRYDRTRMQVEIRAVARNDNGSISKWIIHDGSTTGIAFQLDEWSKANGGRCGGLALDSGLRFSEYGVDANGKPMARDVYREALRKGQKVDMATTFYLDTNPSLDRE